MTVKMIDFLCKRLHEASLHHFDSAFVDGHDFWHVLCSNKGVKLIENYKKWAKKQNMMV